MIRQTGIAGKKAAYGTRLWRGDEQTARADCVLMMRPAGAPRHFCSRWAKGESQTARAAAWRRECTSQLIARLFARLIEGGRRMSVISR